jgi:hypothetical protein
MRISIIAIITISLLSLNSCKKYPENKLWFKKPENVFKGGKITMYTINSVDQMPAIRAMYNTFPYNHQGSAIADVFDLDVSYDKNGNITTQYGEGSLTFSKNKKDVNIQFNQVNSDYGAVNMFGDPINWKILKLTKDGQMKIKSVQHYSVFVIQFN